MTEHRFQAKDQILKQIKDDRETAKMRKTVPKESSNQKLAEAAASTQPQRNTDHSLLQVSWRAILYIIYYRLVGERFCTLLTAGLFCSSIC